MTPPSKRLVALGALAVVLAAVAGWRFVVSDASDDPVARIDALEAAGDVSELAREISNPTVKIARMAVLALGRIGGDQAVGHIVQAVKDPRPELREAAAVALGQAGGLDQAPTLAHAAARDEATMVRASALRALGTLRAYTQMDAILRALDDPDEPVRRCANTAIERILGAGSGFDASESLPRRQQAASELRAMWKSMRPKVETFYKRAKNRSQSD